MQEILKGFYSTFFQTIRGTQTSNKSSLKQVSQEAAFQNGLPEQCTRGIQLLLQLGVYPKAQ